MGGLGIGGRYAVISYVNGIHNDEADEFFSSPDAARGAAISKSKETNTTAEVVDQYMQKIINKYENGMEVPVM